MPLMWINSIFISILLIIMLVVMYYNSGKQNCFLYFLEKGNDESMNFKW